MSGNGPKPRVLSLGRLYCDLIFTDVPRLPSFGTEVFAGGLGVHAGGGAFITAAYLASLGHPAGLAALTPGEPFREAVVAEVERAGVDRSLCRPQEAVADPQVTVAIAGRSDRAFLTRRTGPAFPPLTAADVRATGATHLHVGELATLLERPEIVDIAQEAGATLSLDCAWDDDLEVRRAAALLPRVDVFLPNEAEARRLQECGIGPGTAPLTVVKKGAAGATAHEGGRTVNSPAEALRAVDTTGAGDAFNAGFLSAWLAGDPLPACLRAGNALGARAIAERGGFHAPPTGGVAAAGGRAEG